MSTVAADRLLRQFLALLSCLQASAAHAAVAQVDTVFGPYGPPPILNARLDSLEAVALTSPDPNQRFLAVIGIASPGRFWFVAHPQAEVPPVSVRYPGIVDRLVRVYDRSEYRERLEIISLMIHQVERSKAVEFLSAVAEEPEPEPLQPPQGVIVVESDTEFPLQVEAVGALTLMGPAGRATLERLHAQGTVREPMAEARLDTLANHSFQEPPRR